MTRDRWRLTKALATYRRPLVGLCSILALVAGFSFSTASPSTAASNGLWSVYPTTFPGHAPRVFVEPELTPGKKYSDSVTVANYTTAPLTFNIYASDAFNTPGGGLSLRRRTDPQVSIGKWIKLPVSRLTVPAHDQTVVPFTILPPLKATPGDHVGGIVAEQTRGTTSEQGAIPVTVIQAVAVRVYGRVRGPLTPRLALSKTSMNIVRTTTSDLGGLVSAQVKFTVTNSGNVVLTPQGLVSLDVPFHSASHRSIDVGQLLPGNSINYSVVFPAVHAFGHLHAEISVTGSHAQARASVSAWAIPWVLIAIAVLLVLVLITLFLVRRSRRKKRMRHRRSRRPKNKEAEQSAGESGIAQD